MRKWRPWSKAVTPVADLPNADMQVLRKLALQGHVVQQTLWAQALLDGLLVPADPSEARRWFMIAGEAGFAPALNMMGRCLERGWGGPVDYTGAAAFYERAVALGDDWARYNLSNLALRGRGVTLDRARAFALFEAAAQNGHAKSMNLLARCLEEGWGCPRDPIGAVHWYRASADAGDYRGQHNYAVWLSERGRMSEALGWWARAADNATPDIRAAMRPILAGLNDPQAEAILVRIDDVALS